MQLKVDCEENTNFGDDCVLAIHTEGVSSIMHNAGIVVRKTKSRKLLTSFFFKPFLVFFFNSFPNDTKGIFLN